MGSVLNEKWTLERLLGIGGMAAVYAARHRNGARAAVKVLHADLSRHGEVRERFLREGYAANRVDHPSAVKVMDDDVVVGGPDAGTAYLVMELLEGESLQDRLERGPPVGEREFLGIAETVLDVLEAAHANGVVHRDLKPENLFLVRGEGDDAPRVKVLDFGLARLLDGATITSYGLALGTPSFMPPEQAAGRIDEIDGRTDLFALAATGFRLRTGRRIHEGSNPVELVAKMAHFAAPKIETFSPEVSPSYARVIDRALEFKREDRYANAADMRDDVRKAMQEIDGVARTEIAMSPPASIPPRSAPPPPLVSEPPPAPESPRPRPSRESTMEVSERELEPLPVLQTQPRRRSRSILPWLTLLVFAAIGVGLWLGSRHDESGADAGSSGSASAASSVAPSASAVAAGSLAPMATPTPVAPPVPTSGADAAPEPHDQAAAEVAGDRPAQALGEGDPLGRPEGGFDLDQGASGEHCGADCVQGSATVAFRPSSCRPYGGDFKLGRAVRDEGRGLRMDIGASLRVCGAIVEAIDAAGEKGGFDVFMGGASCEDGGACDSNGSASRQVGDDSYEDRGASYETQGATFDHRTAKRASTMSKDAIKGLPALLGDARRALGLNQAQLGELLGSSKRTVQRWETKRSYMSPEERVKLAAHVHPHDAETAAELVATIGQTLESVGIVVPPVPPPPPPPPPPPAPAGPPPMPRHLAVDAVVCVASEALGAVPSAVRGPLLAAFRRARELGLSCDEVEQALDAALRPPAAKGKREAATPG